MADAPDMDEFLAPFTEGAREALLKVYYRGVQEGIALERQRVLKAISLTPDAQTTAPAPVRTPEPRPVFYGEGDPVVDEDDDAGRRAPRGLTREVITLILQDEPGLPIDKLQEKAVEFDSRVSAKTVYNEVNREKGKLYRLTLGKWFLMSQSAASAALALSNPSEGETTHH